MKVLAVALLVPSLTLAACSSAPAPRPTPMVVAVPAAATPQQAAGRRATALLALVRLPPAARPMNAPPASLGSPAVGVPATVSLVDQPLFWRVPGMPPAETVAWIRAHPPRGLRPSGSSTSKTGPYTVSGLGYRDDDGTDAQLEIGVAADGPSSVVRVDAVVVWSGPSPSAGSSSVRNRRIRTNAGDLRVV